MDPEIGETRYPIPLRTALSKLYANPLVMDYVGAQI